MKLALAALCVLSASAVSVKNSLGAVGGGGASVASEDLLSHPALHDDFTPTQSVEKDAGFQEYKLELSVGAEAPTFSRLNIIANGGGVTPSQVICDTEHQVYCNGALMGTPPFTWTNNCRDLGVTLTTEKNNVLFAFTEAVTINTLSFWLSSTKEVTSSVKLLGKASDGSWTEVNTFELNHVGDACNHQFTDVSISTHQHCQLSDSDWSEYGSCSSSCGPATKDRKVEHISQYPTGGGASCKAEFDKMTAECKLHHCPCTEGHHYSHSAGACEQCPKGRHQSLPEFAGLSCTACPPGHYAAITGKATCDKCDAGTGTLASEHGREAACEDCPPGRYTNADGLAHCIKCSAGRYTPDAGANHDYCLECDAGTYQNELAQDGCKPCAKGSFNEIPAQTGCHACGAGQFGSSESSDSRDDCQLCVEGKWSSGEVSDGCTGCDPGRYSNTKGAKAMASCTACDPGTYASEGASTQCQECDEGSYASGYENSECALCDSGYVSAERGAVDDSGCTQCTEGKYANAEHDDCTKCEAGTIGTSPGLQGANACSPCDEGHYSLVGSTQCSKCPHGHYATDKKTGSCTRCAAGMFSYMLGSQSADDCRTCPAGHFQSEEGQDRCYACGAGRYQPDEGATTCDKCAKGHYNDEAAVTKAGELACKECPVHTYSNTEGLTQCIDCPASMQSWDGIVGADSSDRCQQCTTGDDCPVDCQPEDTWGDFGECSHTCGAHGRKTRTRSVVKPASNGGIECTRNPHSFYSVVDVQDCNTDVVCPRDCEMYPPSPWSTCTKKCGGGTTFRTHAIKTSPSPANGDVPAGAACPFPETETVPCNEHACISDDHEEGNGGTCAEDHVRCHITREDADSMPIKGNWREQLCAGTAASRAASLAAPVRILPWFNHCSDQARGPYPGANQTDAEKAACLAGTGSCEHADACHMCDRDAFCAAHDDCERLQIEHFDYDGTWEDPIKSRNGEDNLGMRGPLPTCANPADCPHPYGGNKFSCKKVPNPNFDPDQPASATNMKNDCSCSCTKHKDCPGVQADHRVAPTAEGALVGNTFEDVNTQQDCCNLCSNHPLCKAWTFEANTCELRANTAMVAEAGAVAGLSH